MRGTDARGRLFVCAAAVGAALAAVAHAQQNQAVPNGPALGVQRVQGNVYVLTGMDGNVVVQVGPDGVAVVDTQAVEMAPRIMAAIRTLSDGPIRWIVNTSFRREHTGGNDALARLGATPTSVGRARVVAHENLTRRLVQDPSVSRDAWPNDDYFTPQKDFSFNGEAVIVFHVPKATTDGDSVVMFRRSDVVATGDIFSPGRYPAIDLRAGGSIQGLIDGVNMLLRLTVPAKYQEGGTSVVPGHGRICDEAELVEYREMLTIVRDRVRDAINKGMSLEQVKAAKLSRDYDGEYSDAGSVAPDAFVESVYNSLRK